VLVVWKLDRLSRSLRDVLTIMSEPHPGKCTGRGANGDSA
jgi:hypothetical protein